jgi:outer membrane lipase/esterase
MRFTSLGKVRRQDGRQGKEDRGRRNGRTPRLEVLEDRTLLSGGPVSDLVVFGDSLSDVGNVALATGNTIPTPGVYYQGRFSGGPIWVDTLAKYLGQPAVQPSLAGGLDYAFGGATVAVNPVPPFTGVPTVPQQVGLYLSGHTPAAGDLFAVWAGANDLFDAPTTANPFTSADTLVSSLQTLVGAGARHFLVNNLPPLGDTPYLSALGPAAATGGNLWAAGFNAELAYDVSQLQQHNAGVSVAFVDVSGLFSRIIAQPQASGFVNTTSPVGDYQNFPSSVFIKDVTATNAANYLFFDGVHPTSKAQQMVGLQAAAGVYSALGINNLIVTSTADSVDPTAGGLSLREMLNLANIMPGGQTITFNLGAGPHTIRLSGQDLAITDDLVLRGPADGSLTISGAGASRIFELSAAAHATLADLTLDNGVASQGGAIRNDGRLTLAADALLNNTAQMGGAVDNTGTLTVIDSLFSGNTATDPSFSAGGAIANTGATASASILLSAIINNLATGGTLAEGGGIANLNGASLTLAFDLIAANRAQGTTGLGGGIFSDSESTLSGIATLVIGNFASTAGSNVDA